jgi:hypothetical protein
LAQLNENERKEATRRLASEARATAILGQLVITAALWGEPLCNFRTFRFLEAVGIGPSG